MLGMEADLQMSELTEQRCRVDTRAYCVPGPCRCTFLLVANRGLPDEDVRARVEGDLGEATGRTMAKRAMRHNIAVTATSLLSLLFLSFHLTHDVMRQAEGAVTYPVPVLVFALWLYGTVALSGRAWGYAIMLVGGLFAAAMIVVHAHGFVVSKSGGFFFVWTRFALSAMGWVTMILSARGLWSAFRSRRAARVE
jgi:hypothetical protein